MYTGKMELVIDRISGIHDPNAIAWIDDVAAKHCVSNGESIFFDDGDLQDHLEDYPQYKEAIEALRDYLRVTGVKSLSIYYWW